MQPQVGETFRHYEILEQAGAGGMGVVFRARDTRLGREVALKFLGPAGSEETGRLLQEARALAALRHPNIVTIYDIDEADGAPFLVLEWAPGTALDRRTDRAPWAADRFLAFALPVAEALAAAHVSRIVHRDLKPANVLLAPNGGVKLVDFGIARMADARLGLTQTSAVVGTAAYMSPEQVEGKEIGPPSDVFSFGTLAYELLAGERPFERESAAATMYAIVHAPHVPLNERRSDLPLSLVTLVDRCLAKDPQARIVDGNALAQEVRDTIRGRTQAPPARPQASGSPEVRYCRTSDGASIAYTLNGSGPLLVRVLGWFTHLDIEWEWPSMRRIWERLGEHHTVVRYDGRGMGMSSRWDGSFDEETRRRDLEAVLDAVGGPVVLMGISEGGWSAAHYAAAHPERVSHLVVYGGYSRGRLASGLIDPEESQALLVLVRKSWGKDTADIRNLFASQYFGNDADPRLIDHFNRLQRASADGETAARYMLSNWQRGDGSAVLATITCPTLVVHCREDRMTEVAEGQRLASIIPGARFLQLPGSIHYFPAENEVTDRMAEAIARLTGA